MKKSSIIRKAGAAALALALVASLLAGCAGNSGNSGNSGNTQSSNGGPTAPAVAEADPFGKQPELTVLTRGTWTNPDAKYPDGQSLEDNAFTRMLEERFNIQIKNEFVASDYGRQVDLAIASGKLPDFLINLSYNQYRAIVKAGLAMDISEVWEQYASPAVKEVYDTNKELFDSMVKKDGKMYAIPGSKPVPDFLYVMWIRQDWLDKLQLKAPTNLDELEAVARAFVEQDPNNSGKPDTVGIVGPSKNAGLYSNMTKDQNFSTHFDPIFSAFNAIPGFWVEGSDGKAVYGSILPETKEALQKLADMYKKGLISPGMVTSETYQLISNNQAGLFFGTWWNPFTEIGNSWRNDNNANWQAYLLPSGPDGVTLAKNGNAAANFAVISKNAKNPEAVIKLLNIYKDVLENYVDKDELALMGEYPYAWSQTYNLADGPANILREMDNYIAGKKTIDEIHDYFNGFDPGAIPILDKMIAFKTEPYDNNGISGWDFSGDNANDFGLIYSFGVGLRPYLYGKYEWVNNLTYEVTETMERRWANLEKLEFETFSKIIIGEEPISAFDTFVEQWKKEGGDKITQEIQSSLGQ